MPYSRTILFLALAASPSIGSAQTTAQPATPEACMAVTVDADRLACYDKALGRQAGDARQADIAAKEAKAIRKNLEIGDEIAGEPKPGVAERARRAVSGSMFSHDEPLNDAIANAGKGGLLDSRWELAKDSKLGVFNFRAYKPVYLLPVFWNNDPNVLPHSPNPRNTVTEPQSLKDIETKFQISFKTKAVENLFGDNGDIWMGYTQSSRWQVYNAEDSRPFRETNYEPEVMLVFRNNYHIGGWSGRMAAIGVNHQSNGRADPFSRSWNRVIGQIGLDRENWAIVARPWWRISDGRDDDNPDIEDYIGRGDLTIVHKRGGHEFSLMARHSLRSGDRSHGALQFDWGFPIHNQLRGHLQIFDGYGESLIDYNHRATYIGLGISLLEWY
ncbi:MULTISPECIES: phospholipase A [Lysobacter]|uniref:phospholipase A n=1 Tax=Lysobacter TaxID=68 RepID=UPI001F417B00|nr:MULTISPECIES: phospholipase A [Lysobacter]UJB21007.1 phospholipase A [Lysobacter capsici]UJQ29878.1 phospholipase A [Lysobacter gummosus]